MKRTIVIEGTKENMAKLEAMLTICGLKMVETEAKTPKDQPKAKKAKDDFDREKYVALAREFNCYSEKRHRVYSKCRDTVYKVMNGSLTKAKGKAEVKAILKNEYGIK